MRYAIVNSGKVLALVGVIIVQFQILGAAPGGYVRSAYQQGLSRGSTNCFQLLSAAIADAGAIISFYLGGTYGEKISKTAGHIAKQGRMATSKDLLRHLDRAANIAGIALNIAALGAG